jgi:hypothetical protein
MVSWGLPVRTVGSTRRRLNNVLHPARDGRPVQTHGPGPPAGGGPCGTVRELEGRGVRFEDYDLPGLRTVDHVLTAEGMKAAWFTDSEGNVLCLHQLTG